MRVQSEVETAYRFENSLKRIPSSRENIYVVLCQKINFSTRFIRSRHESVHIYTWFLTRIRIEIIRIKAETNERGFLSRKNERSTFPSNRCVASLCRSFFQKNFLSLSLSLSPFLLNVDTRNSNCACKRADPSRAALHFVATDGTAWKRRTPGAVSPRHGPITSCFPDP